MNEPPAMYKTDKKPPEQPVQVYCGCGRQHIIHVNAETVMVFVPCACGAVVRYVIERQA